MRLLADTFPLLVGVGPKRYDEAGVRERAAAFEPHFQAGKRYAFVCVQPAGTATPGAHERKLILDWADSPRVRRYAKELCVSAATVVDGAVLRGALTAILWFWRPPFPMKAVATPQLGMDYCLDQLTRAGVSLPVSSEALRARAEAQLDAALRLPVSAASVDGRGL
jgi:hypothetical protein